MSVLGRTLREAAERFGERVALVHAGRALTYAEIDRITDELAAGFAERGVRKGRSGRARVARRASTTSSRSPRWPVSTPSRPGSTRATPQQNGRR